MSSKRKIVGLFFLILAAAIWIPSGDLIDMIIRQKEIVLGKYSRGHFGALFFLSFIFVGIAALCFSKIKTIGEMMLVALMVFVSTVGSIFILIVGSGWAVQPRYVEKVVEQNQGGLLVTGVVRHRPPNEFYELTQIDKPEQARSYPNAPEGYPTFDLTLTTDKNGFRNQLVNGSLLERYPIVAVGDSFVAGSHVSDDQGWTELLSKKINSPIYNLGVSGSDPGDYFNNFMLLGKKFKPEWVIFMIYEGNDFKKISPLLAEQSAEASSKKNKSKKRKSISYLAKASPVTKGLDRFSDEVLEQIGKDRPVPGYKEAVGFMPVVLSANGKSHAYSFEPKRLLYLYRDKERFSQSRVWRSIEEIMDSLVQDGVNEGYKILFVYAPSTPHVVLPLVQNRIPADQLHRFANYQEEDLPDAEQFKQQFFNWIDNERDIFLQHCQAQSFNCLDLTPALQQSTEQGQQLYYSYDQHWTPDGNRVVAEQVELALRQLP